MKNKFQEFIESNKLCQTNSRILLGISGGADSVCLFHLFKELNYSVGLAHCNFQLRGIESSEDESFVQRLANNFDTPFFSIKFDTEKIAGEEGISIQMAARDLRYDWFEETRQKYNYDYIAIAHNRDDVIETFLINLTRGTGIKGLTGIKAKSKNVIRPLIFASRKEILGYLKENSLDYREDSSNLSTKYSRNLIRHEIIPRLEQINPRFRENIIEAIAKLKETEDIFQNEIRNTKQALLVKDGDKYIIEIEKFKLLNPIDSYAFELLHPFGFSLSQVKGIIDSADGISGKQFYSLTHRLIKDRANFIIEEISSTPISTFYINENESSIEFPLKLKFEQFNSDDYKLIKANSIGQLDFNKLEFPLVLRKWQAGDFFMPLGMSNLKKLSDFFIDEKLSIPDKENTWILESNNKIVWVIGHRIDERYKITINTKKIFKVSFY